MIVMITVVQLAVVSKTTCRAMTIILNDAHKHLTNHFFLFDPDHSSEAAEQIGSSISNFPIVILICYCDLTPLCPSFPLRNDSIQRVALSIAKSTRYRVPLN
jgi:hypothetical protein